MLNAGFQSSLESPQALIGTEEESCGETLMIRLKTLTLIVGLSNLLSVISCSTSDTPKPTKGTSKEVKGTIADKHWADGNNLSMIWVNEGRQVHGYPLDQSAKREIWGNIRIGDNVTLTVVTPEKGQPVVSDVNGIIAAQEQEKKDRGDQKN